MVNHRALERQAAAQQGYFLDLGKVFVPGEGAENPSVMIIGEAPGAQEEIQRRPFVGPSGVMLRRLLDMAGLYTEDKRCPGTRHSHHPSAERHCDVTANTWLTNVVKFRPPGNRTPTFAEILTARPFLRREWVAIGRPRVIVPVGSTALYAVMPSRTSIMACHGMHLITTARDGGTMHIWPTLHPSYLLRNPDFRVAAEKLWIDLGNWLER